MCDEPVGLSREDERLSKNNQLIANTVKQECRKIKLASVVFIVFIVFMLWLLFGCTEVPVREVRECSRVERKEVTRQYWLGFIPQDDLFNKFYLVLKNSKKINVTGWSEDKVSYWLERESDGSGKIYCYDKYE